MELYTWIINLLFLESQFDYSITLLPCFTPRSNHSGAVSLPFIKKRMQSFLYMDLIKLRTRPPNPSFSNFSNNLGLQTRSYALNHYLCTSLRILLLSTRNISQPCAIHLLCWYLWRLLQIVILSFWLSVPGCWLRSMHPSCSDSGESQTALPPIFHSPLLWMSSFYTFLLWSTGGYLKELLWVGTDWAAASHLPWL